MFGAGKVRGDVETLVGAIVDGAIERAFGVDQAGALLEHAVSQLALGIHGGLAAGDDAALHLVGCEPGVLPDEQRGDA